MKKQVLIFFFLFFGLLFPQEYKFSTDFYVNKILKAHLNQMHYIFIYEENSDFQIYIGENDGRDFLFIDKQSVQAVNKFIEAVNKKAAENQYVKEVSIDKDSWMFTYDDCFIALIGEEHFIFKEEKFKK